MEKDKSVGGDIIPQERKERELRGLKRGQIQIVFFYF
jgi:hypothetical protein